jgi:ribonuclease HII
MSYARRAPTEALCCGTAFECAALQTGARLIAGVDEVGRGALAGPVVAAAVILDLERIPAGINDSKRLTRAARERLDAEIRASARACAIARIEADVIDRINILQATREAMRQAVATLTQAPGHLLPDYLLIDAVPLEDVGIPQRVIIRGDEQSVSIAAASIIAKVARDGWMRAYDARLPGYGFASHVGYATREHLRNLRALGPSPIHRLTFRGVLPESALFGESR